jgi:hypothetical protein
MFSSYLNENSSFVLLLGLWSRYSSYSYAWPGVLSAAMLSFSSGKISSESLSPRGKVDAFVICWHPVPSTCWIMVLSITPNAYFVAPTSFCDIITVIVVRNE